MILFLHEHLSVHTCPQRGREHLSAHLPSESDSQKMAWLLLQLNLILLSPVFLSCHWRDFPDSLFASSHHSGFAISSNLVLIFFCFPAKEEP